MQAAEHWDILPPMWQTACKMRCLVPANSRGVLPSPCTSSPPQYNSEFSVAFHSLLLTHLLERGFLVSENPGGGYEVSYDVQVVTHRDRGFIRPMPGLFTGLTGSVLVLDATVKTIRRPRR
jgi:hypothetical protein